jgi:hypothetical protein
MFDFSFLFVQYQVLRHAKILLRHRSVNVKGIPAANQLLPSKARTMVKRVPQPLLPRFTRGAPPLHWLPKLSQVKSAVLPPLCTTALVGMVARIK